MAGKYLGRVINDSMNVKAMTLISALTDDLDKARPRYCYLHTDIWQAIYEAVNSARNDAQHELWDDTHEQPPG
jgi:hypothetical protein